MTQRRISKALAEDRPKAKQDKIPTFKLPKSDALKADMLYQVRLERLTLQKQVDALAARETLLREYFINNLPKSNASGIAGKVARVAIEMKDIVTVEDWDKFYAALVSDYVRRKRNKSEAFLVMQKRISDGVIKEMWAHKAKIPGLKPGKVPTVSCVKV